jgi:hypothetical protein
MENLAPFTFQAVNMTGTCIKRTPNSKHGLWWHFLQVDLLDTDYDHLILILRKPQKPSCRTSWVVQLLNLRLVRLQPDLIRYG